VVWIVRYELTRDTRDRCTIRSLTVVTVGAHMHAGNKTRPPKLLAGIEFAALSAMANESKLERIFSLSSEF
jgi:hypothetical protein